MRKQKQDWSPRDMAEPVRSGQPIWEFLANLGDASPLEYGGLFVYRDKTGVYQDEIALLTPMENGSFYVWRSPIDRLKLVDGWLVPLRYDPSWPHPVEKYDEWFHKDLDKVARTASWPLEELEQAFTSPDPILRARAYREIGDYHGWENLDSYPLTLTKAEVKKKYRKELKRS